MNMVTGLGSESCVCVCVRGEQSFYVLVDVVSLAVGEKKKHPLFVVHGLVHIWTLFSSDAKDAALPRPFSKRLFRLNPNQLYASHQSCSL